MQPLEIGDVTLTPDGDRLRLHLAEQMHETHWTVAGASLAVGYLLAWIRERTGDPAIQIMAISLAYTDTVMAQPPPELSRGRGPE